MAKLGEAYVELKAKSAKLSKGLRDAEKKTIKSAGRMQKTFDKIDMKVAALAVAAFAAGAITAMKRVGQAFISAGEEADSYRIRLKILLRSGAEGARMFKEMAKFASTSAFEYREIMSAATALSGVMSGGVDEVKRWMPIITDLAAVTSLSLQETTGQIIRMYSAGAAAADLFREKGTIAMLGFQAGVSVSAEATRKQVIAAWEDSNSKFRGASKGLTELWSKQIGMMQDKWFQFRDAVMQSGLTEQLITGLKDMNKEMKVWFDDPENVERVADAFKTIGSAVIVIAKYMGVAAGYAVDIAAAAIKVAEGKGTIAGSIEKALNDQLNKIKTERQAAEQALQDARDARRTARPHRGGGRGGISEEGRAFVKGGFRKTPPPRPRGTIEGEGIDPFATSGIALTLEQRQGIQKARQQMDLMIAAQRARARSEKEIIDDLVAHKQAAEEKVRAAHRLTLERSAELQGIFFNVFTDRITSMGDLWKEFTNMMVRRFSRALADMVAASAFYKGFLGNIEGAISGLLGQGGSGLGVTDAGFGTGGGGVTNIFNINAMDAKSMNEAIFERGGDSVIGLVNQNINEGGSIYQSALGLGRRE